MVIRFIQRLTLILLPLWCVAVEPYTPVTPDPLAEPWRWRHEEALADINALCMDEAPNGTFWFGTVGGMAHYDGTTVTHTPFDETVLSRLAFPNEIPWTKEILCLPDGGLLALSGNTLMHRSTQGTWTVLIPNTKETFFSAQLELFDSGTAWLLTPNAVWEIKLKELSLWINFFQELKITVLLF